MRFLKVCLRSSLYARNQKVVIFKSGIRRKISSVREELLVENAEYSADVHSKPLQIKTLYKHKFICTKGCLKYCLALL